MILFGAFIYLFLNSEIEANLHSAHVTYKNIKEMLFPIVISLSILNILISSIIISFFVLYASFRVAGPLHRFNEALKEMCNKNLSPITTIRSYDQLYECSVTLTEFSKIISGDFNEIKKDIDEIAGLNKKRSDRKKITGKLQELEDKINQYKTS
jgi:nitrate/nitrite-specific signal transduction histidine kinase